MPEFLYFNQRTGQPGAGSIQKQPHTQSVGALHGHQPHLAANVVRIFEQYQVGFILHGILFQPGKALFHGATEAGADLKAFSDSAIGHHKEHLGEVRVKNFLEKVLKYFSHVPILTSDAYSFQITVLKCNGNLCPNIGHWWKNERDV
jgi:hypothetical protein